MAVDYAKDWAAAKDEYFKVTGMKKPREKFAGLIKTSHTGVSEILKGITAEIETIGKQGPTSDNVKKLASSVKKLEAACGSYKTTLKSAMDKEVLEVTTWGEKGAEASKVKSDMYRALKILSTKLDGYCSIYNRNILDYQIMAEGLDRFSKIEAQHETAMRQGFAKFAQSAAKIKANPTVALYNKEDAARSVTTGMGTFSLIEKQMKELQNKGKTVNFSFSASQLATKAKTEIWIKRLSSYASGDKRVLKEGDDVMAALKEVTTLVKQCREDVL